jgi:hypothetical protein
MYEPPMIIMQSLDCPVCLERSWVFVKDDADLMNLKCLHCRSTFMRIHNDELFEQHIEWLKGQWI